MLDRRALKQIGIFAAKVSAVTALASCGSTNTPREGTTQIPDINPSPLSLPIVVSDHSQTAEPQIPSSTPFSSATETSLPTATHISKSPTVGITPTETAVIDEEGRALLFSQQENGQYDIYKADETDGVFGIPENITNSPNTDELNPQPSLDGTHLVYTKVRSDYSTPARIVQRDLQTDEETFLTPDTETAWDPIYIEIDGMTKILYKSNKNDGYGDIFIMDTDGTNKLNLTPQRTATEDWNPIPVTVLNPDGNKIQKILFISRLDPEGKQEDTVNSVPTNSDEIFIMNADGTGIERLTDNNVPDWFARAMTTVGEDGKSYTTDIIFISNPEPKKSKGSKNQIPDNLYSMKVDGSGRKQITFSRTDMGDPLYDPTSDGIIGLQSDGRKYDIVKLDRNGENGETLLPSGGNRLSPEFMTNSH
jgi:hypothetical protein